MYDKEAISCINFHIVQHEKYNVDNPYVVTSLYKNTYIWVVCGLIQIQEWIWKTRVLQEIRLRAQNMITISNSMVHIILEMGAIWPFNEHESNRFDNE